MTNKLLPQQFCVEGLGELGCMFAIASESIAVYPEVLFPN